MRALQKRIPGTGAELVKLALDGPLATGEIRVAVSACGICGSDLHAWAGDAAYDFMHPFLPVTLGHEFTGRVTDVADGVSDVAVGDRIVCLPTVICGQCPACQAGRRGECSARRVIGLHRNGGFAESVRMPSANAMRLPAGLSDGVAALAEPLAVSINALNVGGLAQGDAPARVLVLGPGPIGFGAALVAQSRGAEVLLAGFDDGPRLALARDLGISATADLAAQSLADAVSGWHATGPDLVIEATGRPGSVVEGLAVLRPGGILVVAGIHGAPLMLDLNLLVRGKKQLRGSHDSTPACFAEALAHLAARPEVFGRMITHRLPLSQAEAGFQLARDRAALKVMLVPQGDANV